VFVIHSRSVRSLRGKQTPKTLYPKPTTETHKKYHIISPGSWENRLKIGSHESKRFIFCSYSFYRSWFLTLARSFGATYVRISQIHLCWGFFISAKSARVLHMILKYLFWEHFIYTVNENSQLFLLITLLQARRASS